MKVALYDTFQKPLRVDQAPDPEVPADGAVLQVKASGICRSDWHGWQGHDPDINTLPHVPGHELAGVVESVGKEVTRFKPGDRVTMPFVCGCGGCPECDAGHPQVCDHQFQPGFTAWGSFAEKVAVRYADTNLVPLPPELDFVTAASLGCRFSTAYRALVDRGGLREGEWVAVHGCGGVGLSAIMIAGAMGARTIGVDINEETLALAKALGATETVNATETGDVAGRIHEITERGAQVSMDALGSVRLCVQSIRALAKRGRHLQVGLMVGADSPAPLPMELVIARELQLLGSHGMQASRYDRLFDLIKTGKVDPKRLIGKRVSLEEAGPALEAMGESKDPGITVIDRF